MRKDLHAIFYIILIFMCFFSKAKAHKINKKNNVIGEKSNIKLPSDPIQNLMIETIKSELYSIDSLCHKGPIVFVFTSTKCPVAKQYTQRLNWMHKNYTRASIIGVYSNREDTTKHIAEHVKEMGILFQSIKDFDGKLANQLRATMTPQAVVIDQKKVIRYHGPIDDNRYANRVREKYLKNAMEQLLNNQEITVCRADSFGCTIHLTEEADDTITYARHIAPIIQRNCQSCHRPGQVAPFSLMTYEETKTWSTEIVSYTQNHLMPPWKPEPGYGDFKRTRRMQDWEIEKIAEWVNADMPYGREVDLPISRSFDNSWFLGEPDLLVQMPEPYDVPADGEDEYRHFVIPTNFDQDMYVQAIDVVPGNRKTVHHVIAYLDTTGKARELDATDPKPGYSRFGGTGFDAQWLGGWAPGVTPNLLPEGTGALLPRGADIVLQIHYYKTGRIERDLSQAGLYFSKSMDPKRVYVDAAINTEFRIPAGVSEYQVKAEWTAKEDIYVITVGPHMHLIGTDMKVDAIFPDGRQQEMIWIRDWDFNWQDSYHYKTPIFMPMGTIVKAVGHFDNSAANPRNPNDPPKAIGWGEKTTDEMFIAFLGIIKAKNFIPENTSTQHNKRLGKDSTSQTNNDSFRSKNLRQKRIRGSLAASLERILF